MRLSHLHTQFEEAQRVYQSDNIIALDPIDGLNHGWQIMNRGFIHSCQSGPERFVHRKMVVRRFVHHFAVVVLADDCQVAATDRRHNLNRHHRVMNQVD